MYVSRGAPFEIYAWEKPTNDSLFTVSLSSFFPSNHSETYCSRYL